MKKRLFAIALSLCMTLSLLPTAAFAAGGGTNTGAVSGLLKGGQPNQTTSVYQDIEIGGQTIRFFAGNLNSQMGSTSFDGKLNLTTNVYENVSISVTKPVTLNLGNYSLINHDHDSSTTYWDTINVDGTGNLTIEGQGTVYNKDNAKYLVLNVVDGGQAQLKGGTYEGNIECRGHIEITGGTYNGDITCKHKGMITIHGGTYTGNIICDAGGSVEIDGGTFSKDPATLANVKIQNGFGVVDKKNGTFEVLKKAEAKFATTDGNRTWQVYEGDTLKDNLTWDVYVGATFAEAKHETFPTYKMEGYEEGSTWKCGGTEVYRNTTVTDAMIGENGIMLVPADWKQKPGESKPEEYRISYSVETENALTKESIKNLDGAKHMGDQITFQVVAKEGYTAKVSVINADNKAVDFKQDGNKYTFTMPDSNVTVSVDYVAIDYSIKAASDSIKLAKDSAVKGEVVTFTVEAKKGYTAYVSVNAANNQYVEFKMSTAVNEYVFKMPASDVTVTVKYVEDIKNDKVEGTPTFSAGENKTEKPATEGKSQEVADAMNKASETLGKAQVDPNTLKAAAQKIVANGTVDLNKVTTTKENAAQIAKLLEGQPEGTKVTVKVQPSLKLQVKDAQLNKDKGVTAVTINVTPMVTIKATCGNNEVTLEQQEMKVTTTISMTLPVPENWKQAFVQHKGYVYNGEVQSNNTVVFLNPHGFSDFTVTNEDNTVAKNGETNYTDLALAINEAKANDTITLTAKANGANITTDRDGKTVKLVKDATIASEDTIKVIVNGTEYTVTHEGVSLTTPRASSGGGGGGSSASTGYTVTANSSKNGSVSVTPKNASKGDTVTVTVKADKGYELSQLTVTDKDGKTVKLTDKGNGKYTFTMPGSKVEVKAEFVEISTESTNPFRDVSKNAYYYKQVLWAVEKGITSGVSANEFAPEAACTRGQMVTFLWKAAGSPEVSGTLAFNDVSADAYYAKAVRWAAQQGITSGTSAGVFSPNAPCTRGQMAMFLYAYAKNPAVTGSVPFSDVASGDYFNTAVLWAVNNGITSGTSSTTYSPASVCTRGQMVVFLYQLLNK